MSKDNSSYSYYLVLLGGTGARCGEIFVHMCANGYFKGGSIHMLYIDSDEDNGNARVFRQLVDLYKDCRLIGSLFGGTGASSLPTISRYLKWKLYAESTDQLIGDKLKIGGCMALPYFLFSRRKQQDKSAVSDAEIAANRFATKTRSALEYYKKVDSNPNRKAFDSLYFLGHDGHDVRGLYSIEGSGQRNMPHIVEFYAAMAAVTFFDSGTDGHFFAVIPDGKIAWNDFYRGKWCFFHFYVMMRFSVVLQSLILEELFDYGNSSKLRKLARNIPWFYDFLNGKAKVGTSEFDESKLYDYFKPISSYCSEYVRWFAELNIKSIDGQADSSLNGQIEQMGDKDGVMDYLSLFSPEILFRQYINDMIRFGKPADYTENKKAYDEKYKNNLKYIRDHFADLEKHNVFSDVDTKSVTMDKIWMRLSDLGYQRLVLKDNLFKDIAQSEIKTMAEGVKNLVNAVYVACMF